MKTAVEWLAEQMLHPKIFNPYIEQAKEMEKQQLFESWDNGFDNGNYYGKYNENCEINCGEQYYNETFKSE
jgi:hypothetical protein